VAAAGAAGAARARAMAAHADPNVHETASDDASNLSPTSLVTRAFEGAVEVAGCTSSRIQLPHSA
jgi:hypothetical protein